MTSPLVTIFIPFSEAHKPIVQRAYKSAIEQTVKCEVVIGLSKDTPSLLRNEAFKSESDFVCFLDADDWLEPNFIEECLRSYQTGRYVYTSWMQGDKIMRPSPCDPYLAHDFKDGRGLIGGYHLVTTLFPTVVFKALGGFNELLPGMEDVDFYMRAHKAGFCGMLCDKPLLHYSGDDNSRAKQFMAMPEHEDIRRMIIERNGGNNSMGGCCGISGGGATVKTNGAQPDDVAAQVLQPGTQRGRATNRWYDRAYPGEIVMVDPEDVKLMPEVYRAVLTFREAVPKRERVLEEAGLI